MALAKRARQTAAAERGALVSACGLLGVTLFKGVAGWFTGSKALLADACQSAADCANTFTSYLGWRGVREDAAAAKHRESIASIVLSAVLLVAALEIGASSVKALVSGSEKPPGWEAAAAIAIGAAAREGLVRYKRKQDVRLGLRADKPLENRSDLLVSLTAFAGAAGASMGEWLDQPSLYVLDPAAGLLIAVLVLRKGVRMTADVVLRQNDRSVPDEVDVQVLLEAVQRIDGVLAVDDIRTREHGHYIVVETVIRVNPRICVAEGYDIAMRVRRNLTKRFLHVCDASVQVQPYDPGYPYKTNHQDEEWSSLLQ